MKTQHFAMCTMNHAYKRQIILVENVGGVDGSLACEDVTPNNSNMKCVCIKLGTHWKMKYCNMQLYKLKLHFGNHTTMFQFIGVSLLWVKVCIWILKIYKCYDVLFVNKKKKVMFSPKVLFWGRAWLNVIKLMDCSHEDSWWYCTS